MADQPPGPNQAASPGPTTASGPSIGATTGTTAAATTPPKPPIRPRNPALRMLGLPSLPRKLPSRNWLIFLSVTTTVTGAIIYDRREKKRATARWAHAVSHLAAEPLPAGQPTALPRKLTIFLSAPPGDGLRVAQDHFAQYVKPVLAASGLDWEFVQGRQQGDVRAVVAERLRRIRRGWERDLSHGDGAATEDEQNPATIPTVDEIIEATRRKNGTPDYEGVRGDIVIGRNTWKEYVRGIHEGWLGPLAPPPNRTIAESSEEATATEQNSEGSAEDKQEEPKKEEQKPKRPLQPLPHNTVNDYPASSLPLLIPAEFSPSAPLPLPHILGFLNTPTRMRRFFNKRALADSIGRDVAAVCLCTYREYRELPVPQTSDYSAGDVQYEQQLVLQREERDWLKSVWKESKEAKDEHIAGELGGGTTATEDPEAVEKIWPRPIVLDSRIASRMRKFELQPDDEAKARAYVVPEEQIEGWIKGNLRALYRYGAKKFSGPEKKVIPLDDDGVE